MDDLVQLDDVLHLFGYTKPVALRKANLGCLPVPAFRLAGTRKGPLFVKRQALESWIAEKAERAEKLNNHMKAAGLV